MSTPPDSEPGGTGPAGTGAVEPHGTPPVWQQRQYLTVALVVLGLAVYSRLGHLLPVPGVLGEVDKRSGQAVFNEWLFLAAVVTGFFLVFGVAGRFAFSTAAFVGLGAYTSHYVTRTSGLSWFVGLLVATALGAAIGAGFAYVTRRAQHFYFAVATLGLGEVLLLVFRKFQRLTGRSSAEITGVRDMSILGWPVDSRERQTWVLLAFLAVLLLLTAMILRSPLARNAVAARDNPAVTETLGIDSTRPGIVMFTLGCGISALAGSIFVHTRGIGTPETFGLELGIGIFVALILGGLHSMWGALIGAGFYVYAPLYLERWERWTQVIWGAVLIVVMIAFPDGLVGLFGRARLALTRLARRSTRQGKR